MTRHFGKVCDKHPELKGERLKSNSRCVACHNARRHELTKAKYHNDPEWRERYLKQRAVLKAKWNRYALYTANYRASKKQRTPSWADITKMEELYRIASESGMTVDHYYPLNGTTVSGLHVETNLRIIPQSENDSKGNKHPEEFYK
jgi:hypothetical protein